MVLFKLSPDILARSENIFGQYEISKSRTPVRKLSTRMIIGVKVRKGSLVIYADEMSSASMKVFLRCL